MGFHTLLLLAFLAVLAVPCLAAFAAQRGEPVDVAPFGQRRQWDENGHDCGVFWEDARDICRVVVRFDEGATLPDPDAVRLDYWHSSWPEHRIPRDRPSGAGHSGWFNVGDWYQGDWLEADTRLEIDGASYAFTFNPVNAKEFPDLDDFAAEYRTTLKLRLHAEAPLTAIASFECYTDSVWAPLEFEVEWGCGTNERQIWDGRLEVFNGVVEDVQPLSAESAVKVDDAHSWMSHVRGAADGIRCRILYARTQAYHSFDETVVTIRKIAGAIAPMAAHDTFSFATSDLIRSGHIFLPDFGVIVRKSGDNTTYDAAETAWQAKKNDSIYRRVLTVAEQTFGRAWDEMPAKGRFYIPLSFEGGRQHFGVEPDGSVFCRWGWLSRIRGKDTMRCLYDGNTVRYGFGLDEADLTDRYLVDGRLPMSVAVWERDGVRYRQTAFAIPLDGVPEQSERIHADDTLVLMIRFEMERLEGPAKEAALDIEVAAKEPEELSIHKGLIFATGPFLDRLRVALASPDPSARYFLTAEHGKIRYRSTLTAESLTRTVDIAIPYITFEEPEDWAPVQALQFDRAFEAVRDYWRRRVEPGARIRTPEPMINDFCEAHVSHLLINTEREVGESDCYMAKVGTFSYGVFSNESCMMISDLDRRGYHDVAERALETWLRYQGTVALPGDFSSCDGVFYGANGYEAGGYNQHHGFVLWCLGEHYWYTRDKAWLEHAAPHIVAGCGWIINERRRTVDEAERTPIRAIERGLLPPGYLEDIKDWRSWLSTNVYSWWGMDNASRALAAAGLPDGERLLKEADAYRDDILAAFGEAVRRSPVVRLRDGSWIPHVPPEVHRRGRTFGWITETLEGAIHMVRTEIIDPESRLATWIIQDFEDNLYLSEQYGYNITGEEYERYWFNRGGISMQANLLCNPIPYLLRDEPEHFLRAYFNAFAASYFPDTRMMTEHALPSLGDWRGDHYKSSDEANSTYWLRLMFVQERGDELWIGAAIPRYWLADGQQIGIDDARTYFGPMSVRYESHAADGRIELTLDPPTRNAPKRILARFRHPEKRRMMRCEVNGKEYAEFDPDNEWVMLTDCSGPTKVVAYYN